ncbi:MAG: glycosyltransferase [Alphaproteobacteria bacterium]|nr:glycosyltransferase [Alphaproteobacteria bacterium]
MDVHTDLAGSGLAPLLDAELDPLFWRPSRAGTESAWTGHVPFAHWLVRALRPRLLVELGTHNGVSYAAFCEAVLRAQLDTRCFAVDTWQGDEHAGFYGEEVYADLRRFHDGRYSAFSELLRCTFDAALDTMPDAAIDLLHIDGCHDYAAVAHDFSSWQPKLSDRAVVLFHDTNERDRNFGVWRLFAELRGHYPGFEFLHEHGLGVLAVGRNAPQAAAALCALDAPAQINAMRERFATLGERWRMEVTQQALRRQLQASRPIAAIAAESAKLRARAAQQAAAARESAAAAWLEADRLQRLIGDPEAGRAAVAEAARLRAELARLRLEKTQLLTSPALRLGNRLLGPLMRIPAPLRARARQGAKLAYWTVTLRLRQRLRQRAALREQLRLLAGSPLFDPGWYAARYPDVGGSRGDPALHYLRYGGREGRHPGPGFDAHWYLEQYPDIRGGNPLLHYLRAGAAEGRAIRPVRDPVPTPPPAKLTADARALSIVFVSGEPDTPGHIYRVMRPARAAERIGAVVACMTVPEIALRRDEILAADVLVMWRTPLNDQTRVAVEAAQRGRARLVFDLDDLMIEPGLARHDLLDALRTERVTETQARDHYTRMREMAEQATFCTASTDELARSMRRHCKPTLVVPNGFDEETLRRSRRAVRVRRQVPDDGLLRLGYAAGSRTHQRDFAQCVEAVARILRERPHCRLVLFYSHIDTFPVLDPGEFPALAGLESQIEWRATVPLDAMPEEMARFDVNLAPLEAGNPFCEAKSELKFFEAALVDVPTIAAPTGPFRRAIDDGRTGCLAAAPDAWYAALARLLDDPALRRRMARAAYLDVLYRNGPERRVELVASLLEQVRGDAPGARAFALSLHRAARPRTPPVLPETTTLFAADALGDAEVTVIVPLYNYAQYVEEALESVRMQSLAPLDLVVIDDASTDASAEVARAWLERHAARFNRALLLRSAANAGLGVTRNAGFAAAETPYVLPLDADDRLLPGCCEALLRTARASGAAFVYPVIRQFGEASGLLGALPYAPALLTGMPFVHAMSLVSVAAWSEVGGFADARLGWEDYEFWCRMAECGMLGQQVPGAPLAEYRVHRDSMLWSVTETDANKPRVVAEILRRHPWLSLVERGRAELPPS